MSNKLYQFLKINYIANSQKESELKLNEEYTKFVGKATVTCVAYKRKLIAVEKLGVSQKELFSNKNNPMVTIKRNSVVFNIHALRMLDECEHINILINHEKKTMIARPCAGYNGNSLQWSKFDKCGKVAPKKISFKLFTAEMYYNMMWNPEDTVTIQGEIVKCNDQKILLFKLNE